jgi:hypothetical protein
MEDLKMKSRVNLYDGNEYERYVIGVSGSNPLYVIAMNPSIADHEVFDQTVIKLFGMAYLWGFDGCILFNLCPLREPDSLKLEEILDEDKRIKNLEMITSSIPAGSTVLATWGDVSKNKVLSNSVKDIYTNLKDKCLSWKCVSYTDRKVGKDFPSFKKEGLTKTGHPRHVSYLKQSGEFLDFNIDKYVEKLK